MRRCDCVQELPESFQQYDFAEFINNYLNEFDIIYNKAWCGYSDANGLMILYHRDTGKYYEQTFSSSPFGSSYTWDPEEVSLEHAIGEMEKMEKAINDGMD